MKQTTWGTHIKRAIANDFENHITYRGDGVFAVESATRDDLTHTVRTIGAAASCSCEAGRLGRCCWHAAGALLMAGHLEAPRVTKETTALAASLLRKKAS